MLRRSFYILAAWSAATLVASLDLDSSIGQTEFHHNGVLAPRQQQAGNRINLQAFTGALGGVRASAITNSGDPERPFEVDGDTFVCPSLGPDSLFARGIIVDSANETLERVQERDEPGVR